MSLRLNSARGGSASPGSTGKIALVLVAVMAMPAAAGAYPSAGSAKKAKVAAKAKNPATKPAKIAQPASDVVAVDELLVEIWPEYDRRSALVMLKVKLPANVQFPARVRFRIPASAGAPHAVADKKPGGRMYLARYNRSVEGKWANIDVTARRPVVRVEYYFPLAIKGKQRTLRYIWPGGLSVKNVAYRVQLPADVGEMQIMPKPTKGGSDRRGLKYRHYAYGARTAKQSFDLVLKYDKPSPALSVELLRRRVAAHRASSQAQTPPPAAGSGTAAPSARGGRSNASMIVVVAGAVLLVVVGWFMMRRKPSR